MSPGRRSGDGVRRGTTTGDECEADTSSTSSPSRSARPTGAATTTSRRRSSARWRSNGTRCPAGSSSGPEPAARARRSAATSASAGTRRGCASSTRRTRSSTRPGRAIRRRSPVAASRIEGIGRQRVEPSFLPDIVDRMIQVPDAASIATMRLVQRTHRTQRRGLHRNQRLGSVAARRRDALARRAGQRRHADLRRGRTLRRHVLQRRVGAPNRASSSPRTREARRSVPRGWRVSPSRRSPRPR